MTMNKLKTCLLSVPLFKFTPIGKKWLKEEEDALKQRLQKLKKSRFTFKSLYTKSIQNYYIGLPAPLPIDPTVCCYHFNDRMVNFNEERFMVLLDLCKKFDEQKVVFSVLVSYSINTLLEEKDNLIESTLSYTDPETRKRKVVKL